MGAAWVEAIQRGDVTTSQVITDTFDERIQVQIAQMAIDSDGQFQPAVYEWLKRAPVDEACVVLATLQASEIDRRNFRIWNEVWSERFAEAKRSTKQPAR